MSNEYHDVTVLSDTRLERQVWKWWLRDDLSVVIDEYRKEVRATTRHGWRTTALWLRRRNRISTITSISEVPDLQVAGAEAVREFQQRIHLAEFLVPN